MWLCCNSVGHTGSRGLSKFPNTTAKTQKTFPLLQKNWWWVQAQQCGCTGSFSSFLLSCHPEKDSSCCTWQGKGVIPISGLCHIQNVLTCSVVPLLSLHQTLEVSAAFSHVSLPDQFFHCLYLPALSRIQPVEPYFFFPSSSIYCLQIKISCRDDSVLSHISHLLLHTLHLSLKHQALPFLNTSASLSPAAALQALSHHSSNISSYSNSPSSFDSHFSFE